MKFVLLSLISIGLAAQPVDPAVLSEQARAAMASGRFDEAATVYRKLIAQLPNVGGLRMNLGLALFQARNYRAAAAELKRPSWNISVGPGREPNARTSPIRMS